VPGWDAQFHRAVMDAATRIVNADEEEVEEFANKDLYWDEISAYPNPTKEQLKNGTYLHQFPKETLFAAVIDIFRLRVYEEYHCRRAKIGINNPKRKSTIVDFSQFLIKAENNGLLPAWWNTEMRKECEAVATNHLYIFSDASPAQIFKQWGCPSLVALWIRLADQIYGHRSAGCLDVAITSVF